MICPPCRMGGSYNDHANKVTAAAPALRAAAVDAHEHCLGGCDCQHKTGDWNNRRNDG